MIKILILVECHLTIFVFLIHRLVREYVAANQPGKIKHILKVLGEDFALSHYPNARKGGVIGLAATAIALGKVGRLCDITILECQEKGCDVLKVHWTSGNSIKKYVKFIYNVRIAPDLSDGNID